jgi:hypothetical protein
MALINLRHVETLLISPMNDSQDNGMQACPDLPKPKMSPSARYLSISPGLVLLSHTSD